MTFFDDVLGSARGYATRAQLLDSGFSDRELRTGVRAGHLRRLRHGVYVLAAQHALLTPEQQHVVLVRSVADKLGPAVAISHQSAAAVHGLAMFGVDLSAVHVTRLDGSAGRTEHGLVHHVGLVLPDDVEEIDGIRVMKASRATVETSTLGSVESAIVLMDSALHREAATPEELAEVVHRMSGWQGARRARYALSLADGRAESPGESRSRYLFRRENLPVPDLQVPVLDDAGRVIGYSDFGWIEYRHLGEFDGKVKYGGITGDPRSPQQIVLAEKKREDSMRSRLLGMSRWTWDEIDARRGRQTAQRVRSEMEQSRRLFTRGAVVIPLH